MYRFVRVELLLLLMDIFVLICNISVLSSEHLWLVEDLTPARAPQAPLQRLDVTLPHAPGGTGSSSQAQTPTEGPRRSRLLSGMSLHKTNIVPMRV